jgi:hypothetical protein
MKTPLTLIEIVKRLKLRYKIDDGIIYMVIEDGDMVPYPKIRPAYPEEIFKIKEKAHNDGLDALLKSYYEKTTIK